MKLARVRTFVVQTPPPYAGGALWFFVKLETEDGLVGWGETAVLGTVRCFTTRCTKA
jgi:L-alanine-DL-glutamate epimerase-like enolase superfamily enzyme